MATCENISELLSENEGVIVPLDESLNTIKLLQPNSAETRPRDPKRIAGAEGGDFHFRGQDPPIVRGEVGFVIVPVAIQRRYVEWLPGRKGFVSTNLMRPGEAAWTEDESGRPVCQMPNGNIVEETFFLFCVPDGCDGGVWALGFRATGIAVVRAFFSRTRQQYVGVNGARKRLPLWGCKWRITSSLTTKADNSWFAAVFTLVGRYGEPDGPTTDELQAAKSLNASYADKPSDSVPLMWPSPARPRIEGRSSLQLPPSRGDEPAMRPANDQSRSEEVGMRPFAPIDEDDIQF